MIGALLRKIFGTPDERKLKKMWPAVDKMNAMDPEISSLSDEILKERARVLKENMRIENQKADAEARDIREAIQSSTSTQERDKHKKALKVMKNRVMEDSLVEVFAITREAAKRTIGLRHFDVQLIGGMVLHEGNIAEMTTGEGKTLVATLSASLNALAGERVHVVTVNDYLARRDAEWMGPVYRFLGLSVGVVQHDMRPEEKKEAYACDIVYGTNNEFGFDYLRDNMVVDREDMVQGHLGYAIVDEVDSILVDEARTPLIISGPVSYTHLTLPTKRIV